MLCPGSVVGRRFAAAVVVTEKQRRGLPGLPGLPGLLQPKGWERRWGLGVKRHSMWRCVF